MTFNDEPVFETDGATDPGEDTELNLPDRILRLVNEQDYAVLCVQGSGQPYGALVAFAFSCRRRLVPCSD